jgi:hypothetical protein
MLKKGSKVRILRKESYWFNIGVVLSVEKHYSIPRSCTVLLQIIVEQIQITFH